MHSFQAELYKKWSSFCNFLASAGQPAVDGLKRMEIKNMPFSVESFREVRLLRDPKYKVRLATWLASSINKVAELNKKIMDLAKEQTIDWMWREGNQFIHKDKIHDEAMRRKFTQAVSFADVRVTKLGRWYWKEDDQFPPWDKLTSILWHT